MTPSRHLSVSIAAPARPVYDFAADPTHLPTWAAGLAHSAVEQVGDAWFVLSPMGRVRVDFVEPNDLGVLDHTVTLPGGEAMLNVMRVIPDGADCEVVPTVRHRPDMTDQQFEDDCTAVAADLSALRALMESR